MSRFWVISRRIGGLLGAARGKEEHAHFDVRSALALARDFGLRQQEDHSLRTLGDLHSIRGQDDAALESYRRARAIHQELDMEYWLQRLG